MPPHIDRLHHHRTRERDKQVMPELYALMVEMTRQAEFVLTETEFGLAETEFGLEVAR